MKKKILPAILTLTLAVSVFAMPTMAATEAGADSDTSEDAADETVDAATNPELSGSYNMADYAGPEDFRQSVLKDAGLEAADEYGIQTLGAGDTGYTGNTGNEEYMKSLNELREGMKNRENTVVITYQGTSSDDAYDSAYTFVTDAFVHTGDPEEGDYLYTDCRSWTWSGSISGKVLTLTCYFTWSMTKAQADEVTKEADRIIDSFGWTTCPSDYQKICTIYDYVCNNVTYGGSGDIKYSAYAALINKEAVCEGYIAAIYRLMLECGVDCRCILVTTALHGYNIVKIGNYYYNIDATWDAGNSNYIYFLECNNTFTTVGSQVSVNGVSCHSRDSAYDTAEFNKAYPMSSTDFDPSSKDASIVTHAAVTDPAVAATCTSTGLTEGSHCSICGTVITAQKTIAATGHSWGSASGSWAASGSGYKYTVKVTCKNCGKTVSGTEQASSTVTGSTNTKIVYTASVTLTDPDSNKTIGTYTDSKTVTGTAKKASDGKWYYYDASGEKDTSYTGFASNSNGKWYVKKGVVDLKTNGVFKDTTGAIGTKGTWYYVVKSKVQTGYTGVADYKNASGWWYIKNGKVDFSANTVAKNKNGWWYVLKGKVQFGFTGLANYKNSNGWWYIKKGKVDFTHNGVDKNKNGWYYVEKGKVRFDYTGVSNYKNANGWWYIKGGKVDFTFNGRAKNKNGTWNVVNGKVRF